MRPRKTGNSGKDEARLPLSNRGLEWKKNIDRRATIYSFALAG
jgi:hypothetical protein